MIYGKFSYENFEKAYLKEIGDFLNNNDLANFEKGITKIDNNRFYVNICDYTTVEEDDRVWEAHKNYLDIHVMIRGTEVLKHTFIENASIKTYHEDSDYVEIQDVKKIDSTITLSEGQYLVFETTDVHKTAIKSGEAQDVRKAIFKVRV